MEITAGAWFGDREGRLNVLNEQFVLTSQRLLGGVGERERERERSGVPSKWEACQASRSTIVRANCFRKKEIDGACYSNG